MMQNVQSSLLNSLKFSYGFNFSRDGHSISFIPSDYFWDLARSTVRVATSWFRTASICRKMWLKQAAAHPLRRLGVKDGFHENRFESREIENRQIIQQSAHSLWLHLISSSLSHLIRLVPFQCLSALWKQDEGLRRSLFWKMTCRHAMYSLLFISLGWAHSYLLRACSSIPFTSESGFHAMHFHIQEKGQ